MKQLLIIILLALMMASCGTQSKMGCPATKGKVGY